VSILINIFTPITLIKKFSVLDHFLLSESLFSTTVHLSAIHNIDNTSEHELIVLQLRLQIKSIQYSYQVQTPQIALVKASAGDCHCHHCRSCLSQVLRDVVVPSDVITCDSVTCCNENHIRAINEYADHITEACIAAAELTMPRTCSRRQRHRIRGWSDHVQPMRDKSLFWHRYG